MGVPVAPLIVKDKTLGVPPIQTVLETNGVTVGAGFTVNNSVAVQLLALVYVIIVVPPETAFTNPVELTVAIVVFEDVQGAVVAAVPEPENWDVKPTQENKSPVMVGEGFIVNVLSVAIEVPHSFVTAKDTV